MLMMKVEAVGIGAGMGTCSVLLEPVGSTWQLCAWCVSRWGQPARGLVPAQAGFNMYVAYV